MKPLFYYADGKRVVFASTPVAMSRGLGLAPNPAYVANGINFGVFDDAALAPFVGLSAVEPGCTLKDHLATRSTQRLPSSLP